MLIFIKKKVKKIKTKFTNYIDVSNLKLRHKEDFIKLRQANKEEKETVDKFIEKELAKTQTLSLMLLIIFGIFTVCMLLPLIKFIISGFPIKNLGLYILVILLFILFDLKMFKIYKNSKSNPEISYMVMPCKVSSSIIIPQDEGVDIVYVKLCDDNYYCMEDFMIDNFQLKAINKKHTQVLLAEIEDKYYVISY